LLIDKQGDPFDDSVLLWTRAAPTTSIPNQESIPLCVSFKIFDNPNLSGKPIDSGEAFTTVDVDYTVKVEAQHLKADTKYWYQFADCTNANTTSPIGATRTISSPNSEQPQSLCFSRV
jgi:alkaline phosphatase D